MAVTMPTGDEWQFYHQEKGDLVKPICLLEEFPDAWLKIMPVTVELKPGALSLSDRGSVQYHRKHA
jgi:hypothetical protein